MAMECHFTRVCSRPRSTHKLLRQLMGIGTYVCALLIIVLLFSKMALLNEISLTLAFVLNCLCGLPTVIRWNERYTPVRWMLVSRAMIVIVCVIFRDQYGHPTSNAFQLFAECLWLLTLKPLCLLPVLLDRQRLQTTNSANEIPSGCHRGSGNTRKK